MRLRPVLLALLPLLAGCSNPGGDPAPPAAEAEDVRLVELFAGFNSPLHALPLEEGRWLVVEQDGRIWRTGADGGDRRAFLDVSHLVRAGGEQGLLGLALEADGRRAYVSYTDTEGDSVLARYPVDDDGRADVSKGEVLLTVDQPYGNHNGGHVLFGPDGFLYYGLGDGGAANDPHGNGQDRHALLGSLLRLDVSGERGYAIPPSNPYADGEDGRPEVWAKGLRNPWRFSFDRETGDLWIADVGQNAIEEVNVVPARTGTGANFGWNVYEGTRRRDLLSSPFSEHVPPVSEYGHDEGCSVTGGYAYRGEALPFLRGAYVFGDYCSGTVWVLRQDADGSGWRREKLLDTNYQISSFAEDAAGELVLIDHGGSLHRLAPAP